jgi:hypothetical protein
MAESISWSIWSSSCRNDESDCDAAGALSPASEAGRAAADFRVVGFFLRFDIATIFAWG